MLRDVLVSKIDPMGTLLGAFYWVELAVFETPTGICASLKVIHPTP
jgi:hypothetical protein